MGPPMDVFCLQLFCDAIMEINIPLELRKNTLFYSLEK